VSSLAFEKTSLANDKAGFDNSAGKYKKIETAETSLEWNVFCLALVIGKFLYAFYADDFQIQ